MDPQLITGILDNNADSSVINETPIQISVIQVDQSEMSFGAANNSLTSISDSNEIQGKYEVSLTHDDVLSSLI